MNYQEAINEVRAAKRVARASWKNQYAYRDPKNPAVPGDPGYLTLHNDQGEHADWQPSTEDLGAEDWNIVA